MIRLRAANLSSRCRGVGRRFNDEQGSIAILMMVVLVGAMLSAILVPMVITQNRATRYDSTRVQAVDAAQAGTDVFLGLIRAAVKPYGTVAGVVYTDSSKLPCSVSGTMNGAGSNSNPATYLVTSVYYDQSGTTVGCTPSFGLVMTSGGSAPAYVVISSTGNPGTSTTGTSAPRTLDTTYVFKTKTTTPGGAIALVSDPTLCLDAGSATPVAGAPLVVATCGNSPTLTRQQFLYRTDLTIQLSSSVSAAYPNGLCLDTDASEASDPIQLMPCSQFGKPPDFTQLWSYDEFGRFQAALATSSSSPGTLAAMCIDPPANPAADPTLSLASCVDATPSTQAWRPSASVSAGAAAVPQWVNYGEFSRCLTVPDKVITATHLWSYPCTQNPYPRASGWNQTFQIAPLPGGGSQIYTTITGDSSSYCLTSPGINGGYPTMQPCGGGSQQWTVYAGNSSLPYSTMYQVVDTSGLCLGVKAPYGNDVWSAIDVETCTGTADQKWNANPNVLIASRKNTTER